MRRLLLAVALLFAAAGAHAADCSPFRKLLTGTAHRYYGMDAPVAMFAAQMMQESGCRPGITAWDNGRGLAQFMDGTSAQVARTYPELGKPAPYNPGWAIPALLRYDGWLRDRVKGDDGCERWGAALKGYNAGLGYVQQAQKASAQPGRWFDVTEHVATRQSPKNFEYSRLYPRWVLFKHQPKFAGWSAMMCEGRK
jgi:soluble lytic murein transglycosylase-like protein